MFCSCKKFHVLTWGCLQMQCTFKHTKSFTHVVVVHWSKNSSKNAPLPGCIQNTDKNQPLDIGTQYYWANLHGIALKNNKLNVAMVDIRQWELVLICILWRAWQRGIFAATFASVDDNNMRLAINNIDVKYATEIYDYLILHQFIEREILELLCNLS